MKICIDCKVEQPTSSYYSHKSNIDGLKKRCKACFAIKNKQNPNRKDNHKNFLDKHPNYKNEHYRKNIEKSRQYANNYYRDNKEKIITRELKYKNTNIQRKLSVILRSRLYAALKNNHKTGSAIKDLGCSIEELKIYLESKFQPGMAWDNWTTNGWHIDHIRPLASFNLSDREDFIKACHYTNLQPLWAIDNLIKGCK